MCFMGGLEGLGLGIGAAEAAPVAPPVAPPTPPSLNPFSSFSLQPLSYAEGGFSVPDIQSGIPGQMMYLPSQAEAAAASAMALGNNFGVTPDTPKISMTALSAPPPTPTVGNTPQILDTTSGSGPTAGLKNFTPIPPQASFATNLQSPFVASPDLSGLQGGTSVTSGQMLSALPSENGLALANPTEPSFINSDGQRAISSATRLENASPMGQNYTPKPLQASLVPNVQAPQLSPMPTESGTNVQSQNTPLPPPRPDISGQTLKSSYLGPPSDLKPASTSTTITTQSGAKFTVNSAYAPYFKGFLADLEATGYKINPGDSYSYATRNVAGVNYPSYHSSGAAIDINAKSNGVSYGAAGAGTHNLPANVGDLAKKWGLGWGNNWTGGKLDPMHFSIAAHEGGALQLLRQNLMLTPLILNKFAGVP